MEERGLFIVFEGIDGSGTSTQVHQLSKRVEELDKYQDIIRTHEPWKSAEIKRKLGEDKDAYSGAEEMSQLYVEDRINHFYKLINPNCEAEVMVISSRYKASTCAFQQAQGVSLRNLLEMHEHRGLQNPDITFLLDVSRKVAAERMKDRTRSEKFERDAEFIEKVIKNYRDIVKLSEENPKLFGKVIRIDAEKSLEEVSEEVYQTFLPIYRERKGLDVNYFDYYFNQSKLSKKVE
jgi:dTMP kinase